ncbi:MAG: amidase family protein [Acholeplasmataceae bacterium]
MNYHELSIVELQLLLNEGKVSSQDLVLYFLNRISQIDQGQPKYNSIRMINPDALFEAQYMDHLRSQKDIKGMLHGIPVLLKDNIHTKPPMKTTAGTYAFKDYIASEDAEVVRMLRSQGAIILGKTNLTELANFMTQGMRNGYSAVGGDVLCAHDLLIDPSGSSAGSAVAISLGLAPLALGTETGGSIMSPASLNGVVGFKPTIGLVSRTGIVPISTTLDTAGPMAKTVEDCAICLDAMSSIDIKDIVTLSKQDEKTIFFKSLKDDIKDLKIGIVRHKNTTQTIFNHKIDMIKQVLISKELKVIDHLELNEPKLFFQLMLHEFKPTFESYLNTYHKNGEIHTLLDLIRFNRQYNKKTLKYGQTILQLADSYSKGDLLEPIYVKALKERSELTTSVKDLMKKHHIDVLIFDSYTSLGPCCGFPSCTIPLGLNSDNMPDATYIISDHYKDKEVLQIAHLLESEIGQFVNPLTK